MRNKILKGIIVLVLTFTCSLFLQNDSYAALVANEEQLYTLSLFDGLYRCYSNGIKNPLILRDYKFSEIFTDTKDNKYVPTRIGNTLSDSNLECGEIVNGWHHNVGGQGNGLKDLFPGKEISITDAGYAKATASSGVTAYRISGVNQHKNNRSLEFKGEILIGGLDTGKTVCATDKDAPFMVSVNGGSWQNLAWCIGSNDALFINGDGGEQNFVSYNKDNTREKITEFILPALSRQLPPSEDIDFFNQIGMTQLSDVFKVESVLGSENTTVDQYEPNKLTNAHKASTVYRVLLDNNVSSFPGCSVGNDAEQYHGNPYDRCNFEKSSVKYALYVSYVLNNSNTTVSECNYKKQDGYGFKNSSNEWCTFTINKLNDTLEDEYAVVDSGGSLKSGTYKDVLEWLSNDSSYNRIAENEYLDSDSFPKGLDIIENGLEAQAQSCVNSYNESKISLESKKQKINSFLSHLTGIYNYSDPETLQRAKDNEQSSNGQSSYWQRQNIDGYVKTLESYKNMFSEEIGNTDNIYVTAYENAKQLAAQSIKFLSSGNAEDLPNESLRSAVKEDANTVDTIVKGLENIINAYTNRVSNISSLPRSYNRIGDTIVRNEYTLMYDGGDLYQIDPETHTFTFCHANELYDEYNNEIKKITGGIGIEMTRWIDEQDFGTDSDRGDSNGNGNACYDSQLESMAWIICPAASNIAVTVDSTMNELEYMLATESQYYDNESITRQFWDKCRDLANIALGIILLVVIISQITGKGIDNYGIKKILPRLILMAILINLSFTICQLAIDVSNILGRSLSTMFKSFAADINGGEFSLEFGKIITIISGGAIALVSLESVSGIALAEAIKGGATGSQVAAYIIIIVLLLLLVMLVAILVFFAMLAVRIMIIVVFAGLSPLAFACYILPNTQNLFKKWWNIFKTALIIYPICGALYGLSFFIYLIAQNGSSFFMGCVGLVSTVLPFLIIPDLVKKSLAGLGVIGSKLSSMGSMARKAASSVRNAGMNANNERIKDARERGRMNVANKRAEKTLKKGEGQINGIRARQRELLDKIEDGKTLSGSERRELKRLNDRMALYARANDTHEKYINDANANNFGTTRGATLGRIAQNRIASQNKATEAQEYSDREQYFVEGEGNNAKVWRKNYSTGSYEHINKKGEKITKTAQEMHASKGHFVGRREVELNKNNISRSEQAGALSSYANATNAAEAAQRAAHTAQLSSMNSMREKVDVSEAKALGVQAAKEDEKFRQIRNEAERGYVAKSDLTQQLDIINRNNANAGTNRAIGSAYADAGGSITKIAKSVEASRQSQQAQIIQTIAGNRAAENTKMNDAQIKNAIDTSAQKLENQFIVSTAENKVYASNLDDMKVNPTNAENIAAKRIYTQAAENNIEVKAPNREAIFANATSKYNKELLEAEASRIKNSGTIDMDLYAKELNKILGDLTAMPADSTERTKTELTAKAYMKLMAEGGSYAQKLMANTIAENPKQSGFAAQFMSKDSEVSQALNKKNAAVAQFLRDVNSKQTVLVNNVETSAGGLSFEEWFNAERQLKDKDGNVTKTLKNSKFIEDKIVDKDEGLLALSDGAFNDLVGAGAISKERMQQIYDNQNLFNTASKGVKNAILKQLGKPEIE